MPNTRDSFLEAITKIEQLFPAPRTLGRAMALLRDPDSDLGDISALIGCDPALAADVLHCANSAFHGGVHISSIDQAVQKIGSHETIRVLGRVIAQSLTKRDLGSYGIAAEDFWAESLFSALFLERLARETEAVDADEAYTCGLLRFIGRLAINQSINDGGVGLSWDGTAQLATWEREQTGVTQAEAGGMLLRKWKFSEGIALAVEGQDALASAESPVALVQALHFAASVLPPGLELAFFLAASEWPVVVPRQDPFVRANGLSMDMIAGLIEETQLAFAALRDEHYH
jgi:HD-like signal output (HDOD) protein